MGLGIGLWFWLLVVVVLRVRCRCRSSCFLFVLFWFGSSRGFGSWFWFVVLVRVLTNQSSNQSVLVCVLTNQSHFNRFTRFPLKIYSCPDSGQIAFPSSSKCSLCPNSLIHPACLPGFPIIKA